MSLKLNEISGIQEINSELFLQALLGENELKQRTFRKLVEVTYGPLYSYIRRYISNLDEAQEVLQEVYLGIHKSLKSFKGNSKLTTWIYGMAHHKVCDRLNDKSWQHEEYQEIKAHKNEPAKGDRFSKLTEWEISPDKLFDLNSVKSIIPKMSESLPQNLKEVYYLRDVEGLSGNEVSELLKISNQSVRVRLHRAREQLVEWVKESRSSHQKNREETVS